jgi:transcription antitermination protein NusB
VIHAHRARRLALQGLCCLDVQGERVRDLVSDFLNDSQEPAETLSAAHALLEAAWAARLDCDALLARHAHNWELSRLALVDRNILRLGVCELRGGAVDAKIVITEALKLAQEFSTAESPRFVNGVLDAVAKEIRRDAGPSGPLGGDAGDKTGETGKTEEKTKAGEEEDEEEAKKQE